MSQSRWRLWCCHFEQAKYFFPSVVKLFKILGLSFPEFSNIQFNQLFMAKVFKWNYYDNERPTIYAHWNSTIFRKSLHFVENIHFSQTFMRLKLFMKATSIQQPSMHFKRQNVLMMLTEKKSRKLKRQQLQRDLAAECNSDPIGRHKNSSLWKIF